MWTDIRSENCPYFEKGLVVKCPVLWRGGGGGREQRGVGPSQPAVNRVSSQQKLKGCHRGRRVNGFHKSKRKD